MEIIKAYNLLVWPMIALSLFGFFGCAVGLIKVVASKLRNESAKVPYLSLVALGIGVSFIIASRVIVVSELDHYALDSNVEIQVNPPLKIKNDEFLKSIVSGLGQFKKQSGSHPTEVKWVISVCNATSCIPIEVARDSRSENLYWVSYKTNGVTLPLGYSRLTVGLNEI